MRRQKIDEAIEYICDRLCERTVELFLGAGVNAGIKTNEHIEFPLGNGLSNHICSDLLGEIDMNINLQNSSEMAIHKYGREAFNKYLFGFFEKFNPGISHTSIVQIPWDNIYTTNYDLLIEKASGINAIESAGNIKPIFSLEDDITNFSEEEIIYYKIHGSIDVANTEDGRLIITKEDYRHYEKFRKPLFKRLKHDILRKCFLFVGYSFEDDNFRQIIEDCRNELEVHTFPLSYAIKPNFKDTEGVFWLDKYNIQLLDIDGTDFLIRLKDAWRASDRTVISFEERKAKEYGQVDNKTRFQKLGDSFFILKPTDITGNSDPVLFFNGAEPTWADIKDKIAPERDVYHTFIDSIFNEIVDPAQPLCGHLITGAAGTGKTTLSNTIAYDLTNDFNCTALLHIPGTPLDFRALGPMFGGDLKKRIFIFLKSITDNIGELETFVDELRTKKYPVSLVVEERYNQWIYLTKYRFRGFSFSEFKLDKLSNGEINSILDALDKFNLLGKLTGADRDFQVQHFENLSEKELIVALKELTSDNKFDDIIKDEFNKIPNDEARRAYVYISSLSQIDLSIRYETLIHILKINYADLGEKILTPTEGVLFTGEVTGNSRHNIGYRIRARHPIIASIIFNEGAKTDDSKYQIINDILSNLDPGFPEDKRLLYELIRRRELVGAFSSDEKRRGIYERLETLLPGNPFVLQHRSILERELGEYDVSVQYARKAIELGGKKPVLINTLGLALVHKARHEADSRYRNGYLAEADKLFDEGISNDNSDPYGHLGKFHVLKIKADNEQDSSSRNILLAECLAVLEQAHDVSNSHEVISQALAKQKDEIGDDAAAIKILNAAIESNPANTKLRESLVRIKMNRGEYDDVLTIATDGIKHDPTSWRLHRLLARAMRVLGRDASTVKANYQAAIRYQRGDIGLLVEHSSFLFEIGDYSNAKESFNKTKTLPCPSAEKQILRWWWTDKEGNKIVFDGKIKEIRGPSAYVIALPENFLAFFWRNNKQLSQLNVEDKVKFYIGYNCYGPFAKILT